jgi:hypothetical protein
MLELLRSHVPIEDLRPSSAARGFTRDLSIRADETVGLERIRRAASRVRARVSRRAADVQLSCYARCINTRASIGYPFRRSENRAFLVDG